MRGINTYQVYQIVGNVRYSFAQNISIWLCAVAVSRQTFPEPSAASSVEFAPLFMTLLFSRARSINHNTRNWKTVVLFTAVDPIIGTISPG